MVRPAIAHITKIDEPATVVAETNSGWPQVSPTAYGPVMDADDWLLAQPTGTAPTGGVLNADGSFSDRALVEVGHMLADQLAVSLPAFAENGRPMIPPDMYVLDHLGRALDLVDENTQLEHPFAANTVHVETGSLPECDFCGEPARYHGRVLTAKGATHAWMCVEDARKVVDHLGSRTGYYYLMQADEVPAGIQARVNNRLHELGRGRLFDEP